MSDALKCPLCGEPILDKGLLFACSGNKWDSEKRKEYGCSFKVWKEFLTQEINARDLRALLKGEPVHKIGLTGKSGKEFEADLLLNQSTGKIVLEFADDGKHGTAVAAEDE